MTDTAVLETFFKKMMKKIDEKPLIPIEHQLWDEHDIAAYFKYSLEYAKRHIMSNEKFPPSRDLPTSVDGERIVQRWKATDVIKYGMAFDKTQLTY